MTPLLQALADGAKVGFDAPLCTASYCHDGAECPDCGLTGLDASDPYGLIGRAFAWLVDRGLLDSSRHMQTWSDWNGGPKFHEEHDRTPTSLATALLRLVARVGAPQETP